MDDDSISLPVSHDAERQANAVRIETSEPLRKIIFKMTRYKVMPLSARFHDTIMVETVTMP
jgi:hypothetical protein